LSLFCQGLKQRLPLPGQAHLYETLTASWTFSGDQLMADITLIIDSLTTGDPDAPARLLPLVYDELRRLAASKLAREPPGQTLEATALVHEAYLRLVSNKAADHWDSRGHFFAAAAEAMRRILVEKARQKRSHKRGGGIVRHELQDADLLAPQPREDVVALDEALARLATTDRAAADLVQLRYFAGLTSADAAEVLGISERTADRLWTYARSWLYRQLKRAGHGISASRKFLA
jgi:RNA polymerase sigma factor (TIGR02999 family)